MHPGVERKPANYCNSGQGLRRRQKKKNASRGRGQAKGKKQVCVLCWIFMKPEIPDHRRFRKTISLCRLRLQSC